QEVPFDEVVAATGARASLARHPLFQTMVQYRTRPVAPDLGDATAAVSYLFTGTAKFDLTVDVVDAGDTLDIRFEYADDLYDRESIAVLAQRLLTVLSAFAAPGPVRIGDIDVRTERERGASVTA